LPALLRNAAVIRSVTVGTSTSAPRAASISRSGASGSSLRLRWTSNSSIIRVSTTSGSLRVTSTDGFCLAMFSRAPEKRVLAAGGEFLTPPGGRRLTAAIPAFL
jgi:hypothetical protein